MSEMTPPFDPQWTPGPWEADGPYVRCANNRSRWITCQASARELHEGRAGANATLMAAAPDLYDALAAMLEYPPDGTDLTAAIQEAAREALAKARGEAAR